MSKALTNKYQEDGKLHYTNGSGVTMPVRSIVVTGGRVAVLAQELADGETGIVYISGTWPCPVNSGLTPAAGDIYGFDVVDEEFNDDLVNNTATAIVCSDADGNLCQETGYQWMLIG